MKGWTESISSCVVQHAMRSALVKGAHLPLTCHLAHACCCFECDHTGWVSKQGTQVKAQLRVLCKCLAAHTWLA